MSQQFRESEIGIESATSPTPDCLQKPAAESRSLSPTSQHEANRELVWFLIWTSWGAISALVFADGIRDVLAPALFGAVLGIVGGSFGERFVGGRVGKDLVLFWTLFWAAVWIILLLTPASLIWSLVRLNGKQFENAHEVFVLRLLLGAGIGGIGGAIGGELRSMQKRKFVRL